MSTIFKFLRFKLVFTIIYLIYYIFIFPIIILAIIFIRAFIKKKIDIGLGPEPMINNVYHKKALTAYGYSCETFVNNVYFITSEFDYRSDLAFYSKIPIVKKFRATFLFLRSIARYKCLYVYFNGGPLMTDFFLSKLESKLYKLSGTKIVVMPYGGDVYNMFNCNNLQLKHAMAADYPQYHKSNQKVQTQIMRWSNAADLVISGCDWVDYMHHWDKLMIAHFSIDLERFENLRELNPIKREFTNEKPLRILHAPNHKTIKGTSYIQQAIDELSAEGYPVELVFLQKRPNHEIIEEISKADIVADQLVIGWYAMFALESMALAKPVICYLREDLINLYLFAGLLQCREEIPFLNSDVFNFKQLLKDVLDGKIDLTISSRKSFEYVSKYHSIQYIGKIFDEVNQKIGVIGSLQTTDSN
ncbi:MAG: hypothetical protein KKG25_02985 [Bacteroidetes bacterium]|nr:hypothetical protein [Bacteroidota bacterium]